MLHLLGGGGDAAFYKTKWQSTKTVKQKEKVCICGYCSSPQGYTLTSTPPAFTYPLFINLLDWEKTAGPSFKRIKVGSCGSVLCTHISLCPVCPQTNVSTFSAWCTHGLLCPRTLSDKPMDRCVVLVLICPSTDYSVRLWLGLFRVRLAWMGLFRQSNFRIQMSFTFRQQ